MSGLTGMENMNREIGRMTGLLESLVEGQKEFQKETRQHRSDVNKQLAELATRLGDVEDRSAANHKMIVDDVLPTVREVKAWKQRGIGFLAFSGMAGTGVGVAFMKYFDSIWKFFYGN